MARSFYKHKGMGSLPPCAICVGAGRGGRAQLHLPAGVSVWLCEAHRDPRFLRSRRGRDLVVSLWSVWRAAGCMSARRQAALEIHQRRLGGPPAAAGRPGSYAWPALRREAEAAFAAGQAPGAVIARLRRRADRGEATAPSVRTMRRWFREGRWLDPAGGGDGPPPPPPSPPDHRRTTPTPRPRPRTRAQDMAAADRPGRGRVTRPCSTYQRTVRSIHSATGV